jgi:hypothetical protein
MQPIVPILLAIDIGEIIGGLAPILVIVFWVLSQVLGNRKQEPQPPQGAPQQPPQPPKGIADEIESFLKQVAQQRGDEPVEEIEVIEPELLEDERPPTRLAPIERAPPVRKPVKPATVEARMIADELHSVLPSRGKVSAHVEGHIGTSSFAERTSQLGEEVDEIDDKIEQRIHKEFDHQVGSLTHLDSATADAAFQRHDAGVWGDEETETPDAAPLADVFKDPESIRRAIILTEILRPPTERW